MNHFFRLIGGFINDQYISFGFRDRHLGKLPATDKKFIVSKDQSYRIGCRATVYSSFCLGQVGFSRFGHGRRIEADDLIVVDS